jgi:hypothetical protein
MAATNAISLAVIIPDYELVLAQASKLIACVTDVSQYAVKGASTVSYPKLSPRTAQNKAIGASFNSVGQSTSLDVLNLDKVLGDAFPVNIHSEQQHILNTMESSTKEILRAIGLEMDNVIYAAILAASAAIKVTPTADIYNDLVDLGAVLDAAKVPSEDRFFWANAADYAKLQKSKLFIPFNVQGANSIASGVIGTCAGMTIVRSTAISGVSVALHKAACAWAVQGDMVMFSQPDALAHSTIYSLSEIFGCKATQSGVFAALLSA